jgi:hypothetical protein
MQGSAEEGPRRNKVEMKTPINNMEQSLMTATSHFASKEVPDAVGPINIITGPPHVQIVGQSTMTNPSIGLQVDKPNEKAAVTDLNL